ncbi:MAG: 1-(5-phosphoribosyl)-5-[(5-phosphoribosylamino)methylideneamino]imidazole-4-carboxamide isomerase [Actinomycetota bacterium]
MAIDVFVAVDLSEGRVVRLTRGDMAAKTVYADDPVGAASAWEAEGARWLHLVDLDRATGSGPGNGDTIKQILEAVSVPVQIGGGIRSVEEGVEWVSRGAARVCFGTKAADPVFLAEAVSALGQALVVSLDARNNKVAVQGWLEDTGREVDAFVESVVSAGASRIMFTDINRDGTLSGPNLEALEAVLEAAGVPVIASGGVTHASDISALASLERRGLEGVVVGRALYGGSLTLRDALKATGVRC